MTIVNRKNHLLCTKAIEWGTKQFPFPLLRVVSTSLFFVMPTEECTYVENLFYSKMFANLDRFNFLKSYSSRKLMKIELCALNFMNMFANLHRLIIKKLYLCRKLIALERCTLNYIVLALKKIIRI